MRIGYSVQGSTDRAFLRGLRDRWCPRADLLEGNFRGSTGLSLRREFGKTCDELSAKGAHVIVLLTDSDEASWRDVKRREMQKIPTEHAHLVILGVAERNIECWLTADAKALANWLRTALGVAAQPRELEVEDPKGVFESKVGITRWDKKEDEIAGFVTGGPLRQWLKVSRSFEGFYDDVRTIGNRMECTIENLREKAQ